MGRLSTSCKICKHKIERGERLIYIYNEEGKTICERCFNYIVELKQQIEGENQ